MFHLTEKVKISITYARTRHTKIIESFIYYIIFIRSQYYDSYVFIKCCYIFIICGFRLPFIVFSLWQIYYTYLCIVNPRVHCFVQFQTFAVDMKYIIRRYDEDIAVFLNIELINYCHHLSMMAILK